MFGMNRKPRGLFGGGLPGPIGGFGGGTWNVDGTQATPVERHGYAQNGNAPRKTGFFGQGGTGRAIAGTIGDVLLQRGGLAPIYAPTMRAKQQSALAEQEAQRERAEWMFREQWKRENRAPVNNDTVADYEFIRQRLGDEEAEKYLKNKASPPLWRQGPDGQFYPMANGPSAIPTAPVGKLTPITGGPQATPAATFP